VVFDEVKPAKNFSEAIDHTADTIKYGIESGIKDVKSIDTNAIKTTIGRGLGNLWSKIRGTNNAQQQAQP
jgi:phage-related protein